MEAAIHHRMTKAKLGFFLTLLSTWTYVGCLEGDHADEEHGDAESAVHSDQEVADACALKPKKQAVCHIPPGNPDNAHTICISVNAVDKHLDLHGDHLGACEPGDDGEGGSTAQGGGPPGTGGSPTGSGGNPPNDDCSDAYPVCGNDELCPEGSYCASGCCVPFTL